MIQRQYEFKPSEQALRQVDLQSAITMAKECIGIVKEQMPLMADALDAAAVRLEDLEIDLIVSAEFQGEVAEMAAGFGE